MQNASHSRQKPWDGEVADSNRQDSPRGKTHERLTRTGQRKLRSRKYPPILLTGALVAAAGLGAGALIDSDRTVDLFRKWDWTTPSAAWSIVFPERSASIPAVPSGDATVSIRPTQEASRPAAAGAVPTSPHLINAAAVQPTSTASVGATKASRDLPWLPEPEKTADAPDAAAASLALSLSKPAVAPPKVALAPPVVAPIPNPSAPPAATAPSDADVAEMIKRARQHVDLGDITGARLLLERAASARQPNALMALAETYDPAILTKWGVRGLKGDPGKARELYQAAAESGLAEARTRVLAGR